MIHLIGTLALLACCPAGNDSISIPVPAGPVEASVSQWHVLASAYYSYGSYSTDPRSGSASGYVTLTDAWRDYYTLGYASLWLQQSNGGGTYYSQQLVAARASHFLTDRISLSGHYAYLHEGAIQNYSEAAAFHWMGLGSSYWFSFHQLVGGSLTLSLSGGSITSGEYRAVHSVDAGGGVWLTSAATVSDAQWSPSLFALRQTISVPLGNENYLIGSGEFGRRAFHFDDEALIAYNQRSVQTGLYLLRGVVHLTGGLYALPSVEYDLFDGYDVLYGSVGLRAVF